MGNAKLRTLYANRGEIFFVLLVIFVLVFFSYAPIVKNFLNKPAGLYYWGAIDYPLDNLGQMAAMMQGYIGHWTRVPNITSAIAGVPTLMKFEYILVGQLAGFFHIQPVLMYFITRFLLSLVTLFFIYFFISAVYKTVRERIAAYILALFATGVTLSNSWSRSITHDLPNGVDVFTRLTTGAHHYLLGILFGLMSIYFLAKIIDGERRGIYFIPMAISAVITGLVYSPTLLLIIMSLPLFFILRILRTSFKTSFSEGPAARQPQKSPTRGPRFWGSPPRVTHSLKKIIDDAAILFIYAFFAALPVIYFRYVSQYWEMNTLAKTEKIVPFNPLWWHYFFIVGLTYFFAVLSVPYVFKKGKTLLLMLLPWVVVHPFAMIFVTKWLGINQTRVFMTPYFVVFAVLAVAGIQKITEWVNYRGVVYILLLFLIIFSGLFTYQYSLKTLSVCFCKGDNFDYAYPKNEEMEAIYWLGDHAKEDEIVLSGFFAGTMIPAFAGNRVYTSWWLSILSPPSYGQIMTPWYRFFGAKMTNEEAAKFITDNKIAWLFWGDEERGLKEKLPYSFLEERFKNKVVTIYRMKRQL